MRRDGLRNRMRLKSLCLGTTSQKTCGVEKVKQHALLISAHDSCFGRFTLISRQHLSSNLSGSQSKETFRVPAEIRSHNFGAFSHFTN